jgi:CubicO group peptidase (beta-lactamase class C family)
MVSGFTALLMLSPTCTCFKDETQSDTISILLQLHAREHCPTIVRYLSSIFLILKTGGKTLEMNCYHLEHTLEQTMQAERVPGIALALVQNEEVIYARGFGVTSVEEGSLPVTPQTLFRIGSVTKMLVGTAVMRLVESRLLDLDRPINEYIEWLSFKEQGAARRITLRMLMSHTSGLPSDSVAGSRDPDGLEIYIREVMPSYAFVAPPGKVYSYSNPGLNLVGYIAQVVGGKPFPRLIHELLFDPLEMKSTTFDPLVAMTYPHALPHALWKDDTIQVVHRISENTAYNPAGGAWSTVLDLCNVAILQLNHGCLSKRQMLSPHLVAEMHRPHANHYTVTDAGYGLTVETIMYKGLRCIGHSGVMSAFGCQLTMVPDRGIACVLMLNRLPKRAGQIVSTLLDDLLDLPRLTSLPHAIPPYTSLWPKYVGTYLGNRTGLAIISIVDNQLLLDLNGQPIPLEAQRADLYAARRPESENILSVGFIPEATGPTQYIMIGGVPHRRFDRGSHFIPNPLSWTSFIGRYRNREDEYGETITMRVEDGQLIIHLQDNEDNETEAACIPIDKTRFAWSGGLIEFHIAEDGTVPGLTAMNVYTFRRLEK